jgi:hypothetical protein
VNVSQQSSLVSQQRVQRPKQLVNTVRVSSATSAGVKHLIQLFVTPAKLLSLPTNWRSETRLSSTR